MMPDREKTRPYLETRVRDAEESLMVARRVGAPLGRLGAARVEQAMTELAMAGTILALADAAWETLEARHPRGKST